MKTELFDHITVRHTTDGPKLTMFHKLFKLEYSRSEDEFSVKITKDDDSIKVEQPIILGDPKVIPVGLFKEVHIDNDMHCKELGLVVLSIEVRNKSKQFDPPIDAYKIATFPSMDGDGLYSIMVSRTDTDGSVHVKKF